MSEPTVDLIDAQDDEAPPILGTWKRLYTLVIVLHFLVIALFYWFTTIYA